VTHIPVPELIRYADGDREMPDVLVWAIENGLAMDDALGERTALVRATVLDCKDLVFGRAKHGNLTLRRLYATRPAQRNVVYSTDRHPVAVHRLTPLPGCS